jgi:RNA polymerase sigma-70 factor (ECF subfamily)
MEINTIWSEHRPYLVDLAFRMLGRIDDAEDVVQDAFARLLRADLDAIEDVRGWLVVVVSRLCLDYLRSAHHRREANTDEIEARSSASVVAGTSSGGDPADRITLEDNIRLALFVVLEQLSPAERAVFVLHDIFQFTFDDVASIVGRTPAACRQIASRARRRIENETGPARFQAETGEHHLVAQRFIAAMLTWARSQSPSRLSTDRGRLAGACSGSSMADHTSSWCRNRSTAILGCWPSGTANWCACSS